MLRWLIDRDPPAFKLSRLTRFRIILPSIIRRLPSKWLVIGLLALGFASPALSQAGLPIVNMVDDGSGGTKYSLTLQLLALMTVLTLLPSLLLMMTSLQSQRNNLRSRLMELLSQEQPEELPSSIPVQSKTTTSLIS